MQKSSVEQYTIFDGIFNTNSGCCGLCTDVVNRDDGYGKGVFLVEDMMPGDNAPPVHPFCRCSIAAYEDSAEYEAWLDYLDKGGTTAEWEASAKAAWKNGFAYGVTQKPLAKSDKSGTMDSGARILDPDSDEGQEFARMYYEEVKSFSTDIAKIAKNTGNSTSDIEKIKKYLFFSPNFKPDCAIAHSWQRMMLGKGIKDHDRLLIKHELYEMQLKEQNPNMSHREAHAKATAKYDYQKAVDEYYGNLAKRKKGK